MARTITLKYASVCKDCGAQLQPGDRARYYGRGRVYGVECHEQKPARPRKPKGYSQEYWDAQQPPRWGTPAEDRARRELADSTRAWLNTHGHGKTGWVGSEAAAEARIQAAREEQADQFEQAAQDDAEFANAVADLFEEAQR